MKFESEIPHINDTFMKHSEVLASGFRDILSEGKSQFSTFNNLEKSLATEFFMLANEPTFQEIFQSNSLICRSESFSKVIDLLVDNIPITLENPDGQANMCLMSSGTGFKIAMTEGFGGSDVGDMIKTVITFYGEKLTSRATIPKDNDLWRTKPETAQVSVAGKGTIERDDIALVSFRFPVHLFPKELLTEAELERHENNPIQFIVRHYAPTQRKTTH